MNATPDRMRCWFLTILVVRGQILRIGCNPLSSRDVPLIIQGLSFGFRQKSPPINMYLWTAPKACIPHGESRQTGQSTGNSFAVNERVVRERARSASASVQRRESKQSFTSDRSPLGLGDPHSNSMRGCFFKLTPFLVPHAA